MRYFVVKTSRKYKHMWKFKTMYYYVVNQKSRMYKNVKIQLPALVRS
jgi:hypothetical protein